MDRRKCFSSWSGGKESALALYRAKEQGYTPSYLLNFISEDGQRSRSHGLAAEAIRVQAQAMGVPIVQVGTSWEQYEANFRRSVRDIRGRGVEVGIFGDIDLEEHKEWVDRVCGEEEIWPVLPLWGADQTTLVREFLELGFRAKVVATRLDAELLGSDVDEAFLTKLERYGCHPCGEAGEYHTFVTAGPLFRARLTVAEEGIYTRDGIHFLDLTAKVEED